MLEVLAPPLEMSGLGTAWLGRVVRGFLGWGDAWLFAPLGLCWSELAIGRPDLGGCQEAPFW